MKNIAMETYVAFIVSWGKKKQKKPNSIILTDKKAAILVGKSSRTPI